MFLLCNKTCLILLAKKLFYFRQFNHFEYGIINVCTIPNLKAYLLKKNRALLINLLYSPNYLSIAYIVFVNEFWFTKPLDLNAIGYLLHCFNLFMKLVSKYVLITMQKDLCVQFLLLSYCLIAPVQIIKISNIIAFSLKLKYFFKRMKMRLKKYV